MTQDMAMAITLDGNQAPPGLSAIKIVMKTTMSMTQTTGAVNTDGSVDAEITYDRVQIEMTMNGQPMPAAGVDQLAGKPFVVTYDRTGKVIEVKGTAPGLSPDLLKQTLAISTGNLPEAPIGIGEVATVPLDFTLPLPLPVPAPMKMVGETTIRLVSIDNDARSARFESTVLGKMGTDFPSPDGTSSMHLDFTMGGGGWTIVDLSKGIVHSSESTVTYDGALSMPAGAAPAGMPGMKLQGTMKTTVSGE